MVFNLFRIKGPLFISAFELRTSIWSDFASQTNHGSVLFTLTWFDGNRLQANDQNRSTFFYILQSCYMSYFVMKPFMVYGHLLTLLQEPTLRTTVIFTYSCLGATGREAPWSCLASILCYWRWSRSDCGGNGLPPSSQGNALGWEGTGPGPGPSSSCRDLGPLCGNDRVIKTSISFRTLFSIMLHSTIYQETTLM